MSINENKFQRRPQRIEHICVSCLCYDDSHHLSDNDLTLSVCASFHHALNHACVLLYQELHQFASSTVYFLVLRSGYITHTKNVRRQKGCLLTVNLEIKDSFFGDPVYVRHNITTQRRHQKTYISQHNIIKMIRIQI